MRFINNLTEKGPRQKFAFQAVKELITKYLGPSAEKIIIKGQDKIIVKMPDRKGTSTRLGATGMEFEVDVEAKN